MGGIDRVVAVTGTDGKTTTVHLICQLLAAAGEDVLGVTSEGIWTSAGFEPIPDRYTNADGVRLLVEDYRGTGVWIVAEAFSKAIALGAWKSVPLDDLVITTITRDHLDFHATQGAYLDAKMSLVSEIKTGGRLLIGTVSPGISERLHRQDIRVDAGLPQWETAGNESLLHSVFRSPSGQEIRVAGPAFAVDAALPLACGIAGTRKPEVVEVKLPPGRAEVRRLPWGACTLVDAAHTPAAISRVLHRVRPYARKLFVALGAGGDKDRGKRPLMGQATRIADVVILTTDNARSEDPLRIAYEIMEGADPKARVVLDRKDAAKHALLEAGPGDVVCMLGMGIDGPLLRAVENEILRENACSSC